MSNSLVIALTGKAGAGKDSVADVLAAEFHFARTAFADALRACVLDLDPLIPLTSSTEPEIAGDVDLMRLSEVVEAYGWDHAKRSFPEVRRLLQRFGTEVVRERWPNAWTEIVAQKFLNTPHSWVVTDCRFVNEAEMVRSVGGFVVQIVRPDYEEAAAVGHASEAGLPTSLIDRTLVNDGNLLDLEHKVADLMASLRAERVFAR